MSADKLCDLLSPYTKIRFFLTFKLLQTFQLTSFNQFDIRKPAVTSVFSEYWVYSLHILYILCCSVECIMRTHAAGEGGNPLQRGVGSPIHTPTLGGGDCHTFIPFTSPFPCTPLCLPPMILATSSYSNWNGAMGVLGGKKDLALPPDTWLCPAVPLPAVRVFIKMKSGWRGSVAWGKTTGKSRVKPDSVLLKYPCVRYK